MVVRGRLIGDAGGPADSADLALRVPASTLVAGRGPAELAVDMPSIRLRGATIEWIVRTNAGWTHVRGTGTSGDGEAPTAFRLDLLSDGEALTVVRVALRVYPPGSEGETREAPPILRISGVLVPNTPAVAPGTATE